MSFKIFYWFTEENIYIYRERERVVVIGDDNGGGGWAANSGGLEVELMHFGWDMKY